MVLFLMDRTCLRTLQSDLLGFLQDWKSHILVSLIGQVQSVIEKLNVVFSLSTLSFWAALELGFSRTWLYTSDYYKLRADGNVVSETPSYTNWLESMRYKRPY
ncbi:unnamed protein product [Albugo candida]|uniref:Uncharacterized protein n=1 Tax=Albugo candida TaxID=65357 RepID=A0A024FWU6_9STRA|nr:unnamed protein product [Albugo candida]|eukprot:CCI11658.1 unnamed protein product [Albugo candida]